MKVGVPAITDTRQSRMEFQREMFLRLGNDDGVWRNITHRQPTE